MDILRKRQTAPTSTARPPNTSGGAVLSGTARDPTDTAPQPPIQTTPANGEEEAEETEIVTTVPGTGLTGDLNATSLLPSASISDSTSLTTELAPLTAIPNGPDAFAAPVPPVEELPEDFDDIVSSRTTFNIPRPSGELIPEDAPQKVNQNAIIAGCAVALVLVIVGLFALRAVRRRKSKNEAFEHMASPEVETRDLVTPPPLMQQQQRLPRIGLAPPQFSSHYSSANYYHHPPPGPSPLRNLAAIEEHVEPPQESTVEIYDPRKRPAQQEVQQQEQEAQPAAPPVPVPPQQSPPRLLRKLSGKQRKSQERQATPPAAPAEPAVVVEPEYELPSDPFADPVSMEPDRHQFAYQATAEAIWENHMKTAPPVKPRQRAAHGPGLKKTNPNADVRFSHVYQPTNDGSVGRSGLMRLPSGARPPETRRDVLNRYSMQSDSARSTSSLGVKAPVSVNLILPTPTQSIYIPDDGSSRPSYPVP